MYGSPTSVNSPIALRSTFESTIQAWSVEPVKSSGRPEEKPSSSETSIARLNSARSTEGGEGTGAAADMARTLARIARAPRPAEGETRPPPRAYDDLRGAPGPPAARAPAPFAPRGNR